MLLTGVASDNFFEVGKHEREPKLSIGAKLSLPFTMGVALAKRRVKIEDFLLKISRT